MNWTRVVVGGVVAGIVTNLVDFLMHGVILANTYKKYTVAFTQTQTNPLFFLAVSVAISFFAAVLFAKTRGSWGEGWAGGAAFGFFLGLTFFFRNFINPLVINGFPYYLGWCWGGIDTITCTVAGAVLGTIIKR
jgi:hypothetical protein